LLGFSTPASAQFVINPTFTAGFNANFGANAAAAQAAWISAAQVFTTNFNDNITVNINVDAVAGTGVFGQSNTFLVGPTYAAMRARFVADATTANDAIAIGVGGSITAADPSVGSPWWVSRAQAKAIGLIPSDLVNDGTTTFGAGNPFSFVGVPAAGFFDFKGVAAHEISEVLGRLGLKGANIGGANAHSAMDLFAYTGAGVRSLNEGPGAFFSFNNGTTLLTQFNNSLANGLDSRDWVNGNPPDAFNQFSSSGVVNSVTATDLINMDVIGYNQIAVPEPATVAFCGVAIGLAGYQGWRLRKRRLTALEQKV
jgi:hypothetical protein